MGEALAHVSKGNRAQDESGGRVLREEVVLSHVKGLFLPEVSLTGF